jgi:tetratricopeptide (TPR) repeat protein
MIAGPDHETLQNLLQQEHYTQAIEHVVDFPDPDYHYAMCLIYGLWGHGEEALEHCQQVEGIDNDSDLYLYYSAEALAYYRLGEYDAARESITLAKEIATDWRLEFLEVLMGNRDISEVTVHPWERKEMFRLVPILMFGGLDNP